MGPWEVYQTQLGLPPHLGHVRTPPGPTGPAERGKRDALRRSYSLTTPTITTTEITTKIRGTRIFPMDSSTR